MDFWEKLERLTEGRGRTKVSLEAGLSNAAVINYLARRQLPRIDAAFRLAKVLGVSLDWFLDDGKGWPPPPLDPGSALMAFDDLPLMMEVARRYRLAQLARLNLLNKVRQINWPKIAAEVESMTPKSPFPKHLQDAVDLIVQMELSFNAVNRFESSFVAEWYWQSLPGKEMHDSLADLPDLEASVWRDDGYMKAHHLIRERLRHFPNNPLPATSWARPQSLQAVIDALAQNEAAEHAPIPKGAQPPTRHSIAQIDRNAAHPSKLNVTTPPTAKQPAGSGAKSKRPGRRGGLADEN